MCRDENATLNALCSKFLVLTLVVGHFTLQSGLFLRQGRHQSKIHVERGLRTLGRLAVPPDVVAVLRRHLKVFKLRRQFTFCWGLYAFWGVPLDFFTFVFARRRFGRLGRFFDFLGRIQETNGGGYLVGFSFRIIGLLL